MHCFIYINLPLDCAKFGVVVIKASMLNCNGGQVVIGICALFYIYISAISCAKFGVVGFKASMFDWRGDIGHRYVHCLYVYTSAIRCAKFSVVSIQGIYA